MDLRSVLFYRDLYAHDNERNKCSFRIEIQLGEPVDSEIFEESVALAMKRYPYYRVTLGEEDGEYYYKENNRPVVILNSLEPVTLNSDESNGHFLSFGYRGDRFTVNVFHGLTDGTGVYEVLRTLLYYYCQKRYGENKAPVNVRLAGDEIREDEWYDPYEGLDSKAPGEPSLPKKAVNILQGIDPDDRISTVYHLSVPEKEFIDFCVERDSTPGTMMGLLLSRVIDKMYPGSKEEIRFMLCTNDRRFLGAPETCLNMVGMVPLDYKTEMRGWPLEKQATTFRGMVFANTYEENIMRNAVDIKMLCEAIRRINGNKERKDFVRGALSGIVDSACGMISYVGKSGFPNADRHIKDIRTIAEGPSPLGVEIAVANECFKIDFLQKFKSLRYVDALQDELRSFGIGSELIDSFGLNAPKVELPWLKETK